MGARGRAAESLSGSPNYDSESSVVSANFGLVVRERVDLRGGWDDDGPASLVREVFFDALAGFLFFARFADAEFSVDGGDGRM